MAVLLLEMETGPIITYLFRHLKVLFTLAICQKAGRQRQDFFFTTCFDCNQPKLAGENHQQLINQNRTWSGNPVTLYNISPTPRSKTKPHTTVTQKN